MSHHTTRLSHPLTLNGWHQPCPLSCLPPHNGNCPSCRLQRTPPTQYAQPYRIYCHKRPLSSSFPQPQTLHFFRKTKHLFYSRLQSYSQTPRTPHPHVPSSSKCPPCISYRWYENEYENRIPISFNPVPPLSLPLNFSIHQVIWPSPSTITTMQFF